MTQGSSDPQQHEVDTHSDLRRIGVALDGRTDEVLRGTVRRTREAGPDVSDDVRESLERVGVLATRAIAAWMAGGNPEAGLDAGREAWEVFGHLAAHGDAPLNEVTKRCLRWRDSADEVMGEICAELGIGEDVLREARKMSQLTLDVTLVHMCEAFEKERSRTGLELARRQEELAFLATHDQLTGLPNRTLILDRAEQMLGRARRRKAPVAALYINIDGFTAINDAFGHTAGDELLQAVGSRLNGVVRDTDALGRLAGDEFIVLAEELSPSTGAEMIAMRMQEALHAPFAVAGSEQSVTLTASIGVATGTRSSAEHLLRDADIAMHRARWEGKDRYVVFEEGMQDVIQQRTELDMALRRALANEEFFLVYQPTFDLHGMTPTGAEALLRWERPGQGIVPPMDFVPLLEETGLIVAVGKWVLEEACRQGARWHEAGHPIGIAVNVSGRQLDGDDFIDHVTAALAASGLPADALTLEITETTLMRNPQETARRLRAIKDLGPRIAIDDFGTGYSSLAHLQRFPVDSLKIDRSFICQLDENPEGETLIRTLVQLGKALSIETLAEGIEGHNELSLLQEEKCDSGQGYLFAKPLSVEDTSKFLDNWRANGAELAASVRAGS
jgi:diguanylate cyclase (GGDEF)-like protein